MSLQHMIPYYPFYKDLCSVFFKRFLKKREGWADPEKIRYMLSVVYVDVSKKVGRGGAVG